LTTNAEITSTTDEGTTGKPAPCAKVPLKKKCGLVIYTERRGSRTTTKCQATSPNGCVCSSGSCYPYNAFPGGEIWKHIDCPGWRDIWDDDDDHPQCKDIEVEVGECKGDCPATGSTTGVPPTLPAACKLVDDSEKTQCRFVTELPEADPPKQICGIYTMGKCKCVTEEMNTPPYKLCKRDGEKTLPCTDWNGEFGGYTNCFKLNITGQHCYGSCP